MSSEVLSFIESMIVCVRVRKYNYDFIIQMIREDIYFEDVHLICVKYTLVHLCAMPIFCELI